MQAGKDYSEKEKQLEHIGCAVILQNDKGEILLGRRKNAYKAGYYGLPGGRVNGVEKAIEAARREILEETGVKVNNLEYIGAVKEWQNTHHFIHFIYHSSDWKGQVRLMEPNKCASWSWYNLNKLPKPILPGHLAGIKLLKNKKALVEI